MAGWRFLRYWGTLCTHILGVPLPSLILLMPFPPPDLLVHSSYNCSAFIHAVLSKSVPFSLTLLAESPSPSFTILALAAYTHSLFTRHPQDSYSLSQFTNTLQTVCSLTLFTVQSVPPSITLFTQSISLHLHSSYSLFPLHLLSSYSLFFLHVHSSYSLSTFTYTLHPVCSLFKLSSHGVYSPLLTLLIPANNLFFTYTLYTVCHPALTLFIQSVTFLHLHSSYNLSHFTYTRHTACHPPSLTLVIQPVTPLLLHSSYNLSPFTYTLHTIYLTFMYTMCGGCVRLINIREGRSTLCVFKGTVS